jgi:hypothetical protein
MVAPKGICPAPLPNMLSNRSRPWFTGEPSSTITVVALPKLVPVAPSLT